VILVRGKSQGAKAPCLKVKPHRQARDLNPLWSVRNERGARSAGSARGPLQRMFTGQRGFTLLELMVAVVIVVVALFGLLLTLHYGSVLNETAPELQLAHQGAREALEAVRAYEFEFIYTSFNRDIYDDPNGAASAENFIFPLNREIPLELGYLTAMHDGIGNNFLVEGLQPLPDDPDGVVGAILFPEATTGDGHVVLSEQGQDVFMGPARDLNGNGTTDDLDVSADYILLPVAAVVQWQDALGGAREVRLDTVLHAKMQ